MRHAVLPKIREKSLSWGEEPWASPLFFTKSSHHFPPVTMFAYANELDRYVRCYSWGLRAPCRKAPPRCVFHIFLSIKVGTIIIGLYICKC